MPTATPVQHQTKRREPWPTEITVIAMQDPVVDQLPDATPTTSDETLLWWAGTLGPTAVLLARHLAAYAAEGPTLWPLEDLGRTFGIGPSVVSHSLERLVRFGVWECQPKLAPACSSDLAPADGGRCVRW